jgi:hypothetical protein
MVLQHNYGKQFLGAQRALDAEYPALAKVKA